MAMRCDAAGTLSKPKRLRDGRLRLDAYLTRTGVFEYLNPDGSTRRELRLPEEVFREDSLETAHGAPLTNDHPAKLLTAETAAQHARGTTLSDVRRDGDKVRASIVVFDAGLIADMESGKAELSCGYECDLEVAPGVHEGQPYDLIQRNIRINHVAVVAKGRAGSEVRARMDAASVQVGRAPHHKETEKMDEQTIKINGIDFKLPAQAVQALEVERAARADAAATELAAAKSALSRAEGERDAERTRADSAEKARTDAADPARFDAAVAARVALVATAGEHGVKCEGKTDLEVKLAVIEKLGGKVPDARRADGAYVDGRFDSAVAGAGRAAVATVTEIAADAQRGDGAEKPKTEAEARAAMIARNRGESK